MLSLWTVSLVLVRITVVKSPYRKLRIALFMVQKRKLR